MAEQKAAAIIIKRIKKGGHGHHGGAWKVAYADFVTAMMAFFLLLWLLSSASDAQLKGIAEYFTPTIGVTGAVGIGVKGGVATVEGSRRKDTNPAESIVFSAPITGSVLKLQDEPQDDQAEMINFENYQKHLRKAMETDPALKAFKDQIIVDMTPDGLRIQIVDAQNRPMFVGNSAQLQSYAKVLLAKMSEILKGVPNYLSIDGHTATIIDKGVKLDNWHLSTARANAAREFLNSVEIGEAQIGRVQGKADRDPLDENQPQAVHNGRIAIVLLKKSVLGYSRSNFADPSVAKPRPADYS